VSAAEAKPHKPVLLWLSVGVAVAGAAAGSATGLQSLALTKKAKEHCIGTQCSPDAQHNIDRAKTFANVANVAFGVGAVALGVATWQFFAHRSAAKRESAAAKPQVTASVGLANVSVEGAF
jgi:hypothetical protein